MQKYSVNQHLIDSLLAWIKSGDIAIPEIQRPFVWDSSKVRDLMDSLYKGFPVGYVITWQNPSVKLKNGGQSQGKRILIDGQQRITALSAAILGQYIVDKNYQKTKIKIAFNPIEERFEVQNPAILKDKTWIADISEVFSAEKSLFKLMREYLRDNPNINEEQIENTLTNLINLPKKQIGLIELNAELDIETVTEIFIRINNQGVTLSQADFAMSKIAADTENGGNLLRKAIDYFCHLAVFPDFYYHIKDNDKTFAQSSFFQKMAWLKDEKDDLYDPSYTDLIRVAFTSQFGRGRLSDLVSLLSGRNFETRTFEAEIAEKSFAKLKKGVEEFINETNFKRFIMIVKSAGFISNKLIRSSNALNFAYILYLKLKEKGENSTKIDTFVKRWLVYSILTGRYSGSPESTFDFDIKQISQKPFEQYLKEKEDAELSDAFWNASLPQSLNTSVASSPYFLVFLASQIKANDNGFLSKDHTVNQLVTHRGDIHHLFPKDYLKKKGMNRGQYNQIANYVYMQQEVNIKLGNKSPKEYFDLLKNQIQNSENQISSISSEDELLKNLKQNCVPPQLMEMTDENYQEFLSLRRNLMAQKIKEYYFSL